jgi:D-arabinose 1-dehydrogenase-like Zn-dependent alcohol dehydrogenase
MGPNLCPTRFNPLTGEKLPVTLGHEFSGTVEEVGLGVTKFKVGDRVVLEPVISCYDHKCSSCESGHWNCCEKGGFVGISGYGGGFAEEIVLDEKYLNTLPEGVSLEVGGKFDYT